MFLLLRDLRAAVTSHRLLRMQIFGNGASSRLAPAGGVFNGVVDFDPNAGTVTLNSPSSSGTFVQKLDANGNLEWVTGILGLDNYDNPPFSTLDDEGSIYTTGQFSSLVDFDPSSALSTLTSNGSIDLFVQKLTQPNFIALSKLPTSTSTLYPNPSTGHLTIEIDPSRENTIAVLDNQGKLVTPPIITRHSSALLELGHLPAGLYYISVTTKESTTISKWVKQ